MSSAACLRAALASSWAWPSCLVKASAASMVEVLVGSTPRHRCCPVLSSNGVDRQRINTSLVLGGREWDLCHILPCLVPRIRVKSKAQPIGTKQPSVLNAQKKYCLDEEVQLSSSGNLSVCIYINFRLSSLAQAVWNDIDSIRSQSGVINWGLTTP